MQGIPYEIRSMIGYTLSFSPGPAPNVILYSEHVLGFPNLPSKGTGLPQHLKHTSFKDGVTCTATVSKHSQHFPISGP